MIESVPVLSAIVGAGYIVFSLLVVMVLGGELIKWLLPQKSFIKILAVASMAGTALFLLGCGEHHLHLAYEIYQYPEQFNQHFLIHMFWEELVQAVGVWAPIPLIFIIRAILKNIRKRNTAKIG